LLRRSLTHRALAPASAAGGDGDSVVDRFRRTAARQPDAIALAGTARTLTYGELARASDALAHVLLDNGVAPGDRVVVAVGERATQTLLALATLKVGAAYVPVDLANPPERLAYLLNDCGAKRVLTTRRDRSSLPATGADIVCADELDDATLARHAGRPLPRIAIAAGQPAYCIYTSGSTGQPKGVLVTHGGLANLVDWHVDAFALDAGARAAMLAGPGFDAAVWEIWP
ncbi:AMP-binding protein, partial [Burkholderia oklahomensis]